MMNTEQAIAKMNVGQRLYLVPITLAEAKAFVLQHHRHNPPSVGHVVSVGCAVAGRIVGVAMVGRPVSRKLAEDGYTAEVTRCCTDGTRNACSFLYGAAWRAVRALGYRRLVTYSLQTEPGTSLVAAGFRVVAEVKARSSGWSCASRPRVETGSHRAKLRWELAL